jgi:ankyrin repeat protein
MGWSGLSNSLSYTGARTLTDDEVKLWDRLCADSTIASKYPMYVMPVSEVLKLDELLPHEELKDKLVEWRPGMAKVLFCSHTWLKYKHPDDNAKSKISMLKKILLKIRDKTIGDLAMPASYYDPINITAKDLHRDLADGYVWFDIMSIPQADPVMMRNAVSSIVRYVSDSAYFFVLAGPWRHENGSIRDERAWGGRGWCRMEVCANALSPVSKPVVICRSEHSLSVLPQGGMIKKSALFHTVGLGKFTVEADRQVLGAVVQELVRVRKAFALAVNDLIMLRILHAATAKLLQGDMGVVMPPEEPYDEWMKSLHYEGVNLAVEGASTGLTPLRYAVMSNRPDIVKRLLQDEGEELRRLAAGGKSKAKVKDARPCGLPGAFVEAPLKFSIPLIEAPKAQTILMSACAWYDNAEMVKLLAEHNADICAIDGGVGHAPIIYAAGNENLNSMQALIDCERSYKGLRIDAWHGSPASTPDPECKRMGPHMGPMIMFAEYGCLDGLKGFAERFPESFRRQFTEDTLGMGINIMTHGAAIGGDYYMIEWLCEQAKAFGVSAANLHSAPWDPRIKRVLKIIFFLNKVMRKPPAVVVMFLNILGTTPLHCAAVMGNLGVVELLINEGAVIDSNVHLLGRTPLIAAVVAGHENIVRRLLELGASPALTDTRKKRTPLQWANRTGKNNIAALLVHAKMGSRALLPPREPQPQPSVAKGGKKYQVKVAPE